WWAHWFVTQHLGTFVLPGIFAGLGWIVFSIARPSWDVRQPPGPINSTASPTPESLAQIWAPPVGIGLVLLGALLCAWMAAHDIPGGDSWNWWRFAAYPVGGAAGALIVFVLAIGVAHSKRAL